MPATNNSFNEIQVNGNIDAQFITVGSDELANGLATPQLFHMPAQSLLPKVNDSLLVIKYVVTSTTSTNLTFIIAYYDRMMDNTNSSDGLISTFPANSVILLGEACALQTIRLENVYTTSVTANNTKWYIASIVNDTANRQVAVNIKRGAATGSGGFVLYLIANCHPILKSIWTAQTTL